MTASGSMAPQGAKCGDDFLDLTRTVVKDRATAELTSHLAGANVPYSVHLL